MESKRIRVLQLGSPTALYGAEHWILALVRHLDRTRIESIVSVVKDAPDLETALCREADAAGFETCVFEAHGRVNIDAVKQVNRYILQNNVHILHTHGYKTDIIGRLATFGTTCKIISTPHGWSRDAGIKSKLYEYTDRLVFPFLDAVVPLSESIYRGLKWIPGLHRKLYLIKNGVDISEIGAVSNIADDIKVWKGEGCFVLGYVGQLIPRKGLTVLLNAFANLDIPKKKLAIVGEGGQRGELQKLSVDLGVSDQIKFFGFREDRISILKGFDVFILPSKLEGIPRCLMEAMVSRVPVIASDIPGCRDLVTDGKTGLLFKVNDVDSLLEQITKITNPDLRSVVSRNAHEFATQEYLADKMADNYLALYMQLCI